MSSMLEPADLVQLERVGIREDQARDQLSRLVRGTRYLDLDRPARLGDGIEVLEAVAQAERQRAFERGLERVTRFVPASGAASRMFADLLAQLSEDRTTASPQPHPPFFEQPWPFRAALERALARDDGSDSEIDRGRALRTLLIGEPGSSVAPVEQPAQAGLARLPKALIPFHREGQREVTAFEEQVEEAFELAALGGSSRVQMHFTVSTEHQSWIEALAEQTRLRLSEQATIEISTSTQAKSTDTLAIDASHKPVRTGSVATGTKGISAPLVLRPGGHGALLHNLQASDSDLVLIKNIDNVQPKSQRAATTQWKAALLGALVLHQDEVFELIEALNQPTDAVVSRAVKLLARFGRQPRAHDAEALKNDLNRPIRLCGVVPNSGEPGGGPFWVRGPDGERSLQIVEGAQIDPSNTEQQAVLHSSTHFNPVDLACGLRDHQGQPFDLTQYRDDETYFVANKTVDGQPIRALEHPGLWNGAMAHWLTLFVEAPAATFTPVKTVWDLLRAEHQERTTPKTEPPNAH